MGGAVAGDIRQRLQSTNGGPASGRPKGSRSLPDEDSNLAGRGGCRKVAPLASPADDGRC
jgi:hypothetical protein